MGIKPRTIYVVCATPRSGSGLLCEALWSTGLAGRPDEYLHPGTAQEYANEWKTADFSDYFAKVWEHGTTPNGVFGFKIMWTDFHDHFLKMPPGESSSALADIVPELRYIWIRRQDHLRQAISIWKRKQTGIISWYNGEPPEYDFLPEFDYASVNQLVQLVGTWDQNWANYFQSRGISPFVITYEEELQQEYRVVIRRILNYLNIPFPEDLKIQARRRKLSDDLSEHFVRLYQTHH